MTSAYFQASRNMRQKENRSLAEEEKNEVFRESLHLQKNLSYLCRRKRTDKSVEDKSKSISLILN